MNVQNDVTSSPVPLLYTTTTTTSVIVIIAVRATPLLPYLGRTDSRSFCCPFPPTCKPLLSLYPQPPPRAPARALRLLDSTDSASLSPLPPHIPPSPSPGIPRDVHAALSLFTSRSLTRARRSLAGDDSAWTPLKILSVQQKLNTPSSTTTTQPTNTTTTAITTIITTTTTTTTTHEQPTCVGSALRRY